MDPPDILTRPLQSGASANSRLHPPPTASPYSRAHSLPSVSPALNHAHSMEAATPPAPPASAVAAASEAAAAAAATSSLPPPGLDAWMQTQFAAAFHKQMQKIDCQRTKQTSSSIDDFKGNKHQLPLARIKKIMKSDEDVRMISAEAPILFAKACELFILDLTLRAYAYTEHAPSKRRTLQRNDIAAAIQNAEIFDFLQEIVPVQPQDPSEEGTPPHRSPEESTRSRRINATPDVLLERPLLDPYGDALPVPVHQHLAHRASRQHSAAAAANAAAAAQAAQEAAAHAAMQSQYAAYASRNGGAVNLYSGLTPEGLLANAASPGYTSSDPSAYGMTSMSRGTSLDLMGAGSGVGGGVVMSTPHFGGGSMAIDQLPDAPPDTPNTGNATGSTLTPLPPARRPMQTGLSGSIHSPAVSNLTPPTMLSPQHTMPQQHPHAAAQMQMYHAQQQHQMLHHTPQQQTPQLQLHPQPQTPSAAFFPGAGLPLHTPNPSYLQLQQQQQHQQQLHTQWLESNGGGSAAPHSPAAVPSVSTPSSSTNTLSTPNMFSSSYSAEGSIDDEQQ